jgi:spore coat polysaccharide biosynthesis protein SpsF
MNSVVTVVQARMASTRLPGKVLMPLGGMPLLVSMVRRLQRATLAGTIVVATTTAAGDDPVVALCEAHALPVFRGHPTDLLDRHYQCALQWRADVVLKIPSDCPLIDPQVVDRVITAFNGGQFDFVSNLHPASYPDGQDVEIMSFATLERAWREASADFEREHTTPYIWEHAEKFCIGNVAWESGRDYSMSHRITIDYPEDYAAIVAIHEALAPTRPEFGINEIAQLLDARADLMAINARYAGVNWYRHHLNDLKTIRPDQSRVI